MLFRYVWTHPSNKGQRAYRLLCAAYWQFHHRFVRVPFVVRLDNGYEWLIRSGHGNASGTLYVALYESRYIGFVRRHVVHGGTMCDVGASDGLYSLLVHKAFAHVHTFEPDPEAVAFARVEYALNGITNVTQHNVGVSDAKGRLTFVRDGLWQIPEPGRDVSGLEKRDVEVVTLDDCVGQLTDLTFLKIDTEGHELAVLRGATSLLRNSRRLLVHVEVTANKPQVLALLNGAGFKVFAVSEDGRPTGDRNIADREHDFMAVGPDHPLYPAAPDLATGTPLASA